MKKWFFALLVLSSISLMPLQAQTQPPGGTPPYSGGSSGQSSNSTITLTGGEVFVSSVKFADYQTSNSRYGRSNTGNANVEMSGDVTPHWKWNSTTSPPPKILVIYDVDTNFKFINNNNSAGSGTCSDGFTNQNLYYKKSQGNIVEGHSHYREYKIVPTATLLDSTAVAGAKKLPSVSPSAKVINGYSTQGCSVWITVTAVPAYESGTNCSFAFAKPVGVPEETTLTGATVKLGADTISSNLSDWSGTPKTVRYMSNHFADNSEIPLSIAYTASFNAGTDASNNPITLTQTFAETQRKVTYNKFATVFKQDNPASISEFIITSIQGTMNHTPVTFVNDGNNYNTDKWLYTKPNFLQECREATALHFNLHGGNYRIDDPNRPPFTIPMGRLSPATVSPTAEKTITSEIATEVKKRDFIPPFNVIYAASCATGAFSTFAKAFGIPLTTEDTNKAYIGFSVDALRDYQTAEIFWEIMVSGYYTNPNPKKGKEKENELIHCEMTVEKAVDIAQKVYDLQKAYPAQLIIYGDKKATLNTLYGYPKSTKVWYKIL
jgi:hypothetical protein